MGVLKISCDYCGGSWEVYSRDIKNEKSRACPHCSHGIERQTWQNQILPAFAALEDANRELFKDHTGYHVPLFTVSYEPDIIFRNSEHGQIAANISNMMSDIEDLREALVK